MLALVGVASGQECPAAEVFIAGILPGVGETDCRRAGVAEVVLVFFGVDCPVVDVLGVEHLTPPAPVDDVVEHGPELPLAEALSMEQPLELVPVLMLQDAAFVAVDVAAILLEPPDRVFDLPKLLPRRNDPNRLQGPLALDAGRVHVEAEHAVANPYAGQVGVPVADRDLPERATVEADGQPCLLTFGHQRDRILTRPQIEGVGLEAVHVVLLGLVERESVVEPGELDGEIVAGQPDPIDWLRGGAGLRLRFQLRFQRWLGLRRNDARALRVGAQFAECGDGPAGQLFSRLDVAGLRRLATFLKTEQQHLHGIGQLRDPGPTKHAPRTRALTMGADALELEAELLPPRRQECVAARARWAVGLHRPPMTAVVNAGEQHGPQLDQKRPEGLQLGQRSLGPARGDIPPNPLGQLRRHVVVAGAVVRPVDVHDQHEVEDELLQPVGMRQDLLHPTLTGVDAGGLRAVFARDDEHVLAP